MHPLDKTYYSPYYCAEDAIRKARAINAAFITRPPSKWFEQGDDANDILGHFNWKISKNQLKILRKTIEENKTPHVKHRAQVLIQSFMEKVNSRNWCLWVEWEWFDEKCTKGYFTWKFWTRWNACFSPADLLP